MVGVDRQYGVERLVKQINGTARGCLADRPVPAIPAPDRVDHQLLRRHGRGANLWRSTSHYVENQNDT